MKRRDARRLALGILLNLWRERVHAISQRELERAVGLSWGRVTKLERGETEPRPEEMERIARYFDTTPERWRKLARPIEEDLLTRGNGLEPDGAYPAPVVEPDSLVDGTAPAAGLPAELLKRWDEQRADEHRVRRNRDLLTIETNAYLFGRQPDRD